MRTPGIFKAVPLGTFGNVNIVAPDGKPVGFTGASRPKEENEANALMFAQASEMRSYDEIYKAHDLIVGILLKEVPVEFDDENRRLLDVAASTLCWVLHHQHNPQFSNMLEYLKTETAKIGYTLTRRDN